MQETTVLKLQLVFVIFCVFEGLIGVGYCDSLISWDTAQRLMVRWGKVILNYTHMIVVIIYPLCFRDFEVVMILIVT